MSRSPIHGSPRPLDPRPVAPLEHAMHPAGDTGLIPRVAISPQEIPDTERAFFVAEFRGTTIVVSFPVATEEGVAALVRSVDGFAPGDTRFVAVVPDRAVASRIVEVAAEVGIAVAVLSSPVVWHDSALARLWMTTADERVVVVVASSADTVPETAGFVSARLRATKMVLTDPGGGWGTPPRSFVELAHYQQALGEDLRARGCANLLPAAMTALRGGAASVNLCRPEDVEVELFTFDGAGSVLTLGGYIELTDLRVDDLPAVEALVAQGVEDGILKPRSREEVARMAVGGLGARVSRTGHLAGVVGLETDAYGREGLGEISSLITVSEFSGAGSGGLLVDGLVERAREIGLRALFAVTVSDDAAAFFLRRGFHEVPREEVPAAKWEGYDPARLALARCFWKDA
ncbi:GNAT family N-acetyltransferase [Salana multivorans]